MSDVLVNFYESAFVAAGEGGDIYHEPLSIIGDAGHLRKLEILQDLELPDLSNATVVDYGVGAWGFGCIYPKLKACRVAIGVDISQSAIDESARVSAKDSALKGKDVRFLTSQGYEIGLDSDLADVVFVGECVEHVEDTHAFLEEIWRITKPGGTVIMTTPNQTPYLYRELGLRYATGFEHVALMDADEFEDYLAVYFNVAEKRGFMGSVSPHVDALLDDPAVAREYAKMGNRDWDFASGLVARVIKPKKTKHKLVGYTHKTVESYDAKATPKSIDLSLYKSIMGREASGKNAKIKVKVPEGSVRAELNLWSHPWSGFAKIKTSCRVIDVNLYAHISGCIRVSLTEKDIAGLKEIVITPTGKMDPRSQGAQVIFFRAIFSEPIDKAAYKKAKTYLYGDG